MCVIWCRKTHGCLCSVKRRRVLNTVTHYTSTLHTVTSLNSCIDSQHTEEITSFLTCTARQKNIPASAASFLTLKSMLLCRERSDSPRHQALRRGHCFFHIRILSLSGCSDVVLPPGGAWWLKRSIVHWVLFKYLNALCLTGDMCD